MIRNPARVTRILKKNKALILKSSEISVEYDLKSSPISTFSFMLDS